MRDREVTLWELAQPLTRPDALRLVRFFASALPIPYTREHNDQSFYLKLVAAMGRYIYGVYLFMG